MKLFLKIIFALLLINPFQTDSANIETVNDSIQMQNYYDAAIKMYSMGYNKQALDSLKYAFNMGKETYGENHFYLRNINNALGIIYRNLGQYDNAIRHFLLAEESYLPVSKKNELSIAKLYNNIGNVYYSKFNYGTALEYYQRAINIFSSQAKVNHADLTDIYYSIANIYHEQGHYEKALQIIERFGQQAHSDTKLYFLSLKAATLQLLDNYSETYKAYNEAIKYAKNLYSDTDLNIVFEYLNFATFLISNNDFDEASNVLDNVHDIFLKKSIDEGVTLALYYKTKGYYYENLKVKIKNIDEFRERKSKNLFLAINFYKKGLSALNFDIAALQDPIIDTGKSLSLTSSLDFLKLIADTYIRIADLFEENNIELATEYIFNALEYYKQTSNLIQQARKEIYSDENKIQLSELEEATFYKIIRTAYKAFEASGDNEIIEIAFQNAERLKASSVFDKLVNQLAKENSLIPDSLTELEKTLNYSITSYNEKLYNLSRSEDTDSSEIAKTDSIVFQLKKQRDELNRYMENNYSEYYNLKYLNSNITIPDVQKKLKNHEILIEYVLNDTDSIPELYAFIISYNHSQFMKLTADPDLIHSIEEVFRFLSNPDFLLTTNNDSKKFCIAAHELYNYVIKPFENVIRNKNLILIPDGILSYIPFDTLMDTLPDTSQHIQFTRLPYLIRNHTINYAYSANLLVTAKPPKRNTKNRILAFAPEYHNETVIFENEHLTLIPLPGTKDEVSLISEDLETRLFEGDEATEQNFRKYSKDYDILHLAMHAFINDSLPAFSRFAFTQVNREKSQENDGWLNTADIYNMDINARLTVLSACNTGRGDLKRGEGVMSLARGFIYAGCPTIIMTLWEVEDNAGTNIMKYFYNYLKRGNSTDEALRQAKLRYLENSPPHTAHPHFWLGYVSIGDSSPLYKTHDLYFIALLILIVAGILSDHVIKRKKRKTLL